MFNVVRLWNLTSLSGVVCVKVQHSDATSKAVGSSPYPRTGEDDVQRCD